MKTLAFLISFIVSVCCLEAQTITVTIDNVLSDEGQVLVALHTKETFMKGPGVMNMKTNIYEGKVVAIFENVEPGTYAIMALHDKNGNEQMDYYPGGMPKEDYGMSNNPMSFGPPFFSDAKFEMKDQDLEIKIRF